MYTFERFYYFRPYRGKSNYWLNRYGEGAISSHQKATLYTATGAADQRLQVHKVDGGCQLISALSTDFKDETKMFGLNIYGSKAGSVCDFFPVYNNFDDALIDLLTVDAANSLYRIKLIKHNLYLTPASNANNAGLTWETASNADNQVWQLCASQSSGGSSGGDSTNSGGGVGPYGDYVYPTVSRKYSRTYSYSHPAMDIRDIAQDHNVYAIADGIVAYTQNSSGSWQPGTTSHDNTMESMGNCIAINHVNPFNGHSDDRSGAYARSIYMHMAENPTVRPGDTVKKGQIIGTIGTTGVSSANHLHFSISVGNGSSLAPGQTGWIQIKFLPNFNPVYAFPEYSL